MVAMVGVALPFALGYASCRLLHVSHLSAIVTGAALTATSVGVTARVLSDLGLMHLPESQVVLGAAVCDDVVGLVILAVVSDLTLGHSVTLTTIAVTAGSAFGFLLATLVIGSFLAPMLLDRAARAGPPETATFLGLLSALGMAWLAERAGSAPVVGAFAAGLLMARTPQVHAIEKGVAVLGELFVPVFFIAVGAAVDLRSLNPFNPANGRTLVIGLVLIVAAVVGKYAAGYSPFWFRGRKSFIGIGMIPRGEVGLIFAQMGLASGLMDEKLFSAVTLMVMVTTLVVPPLLKRMAPIDRVPRPSDEFGAIEELATSS
jgi:Kef-type K+ transport system membrane component KefB